MRLEQASPDLLERAKPAFPEGEAGQIFLRRRRQNGRFFPQGKGHFHRKPEQLDGWRRGFPTPAYWSTGGYGVIPSKRRTYDFGSREENLVNTSRMMKIIWMSFSWSTGQLSLLRDFYQLTGAPVLLPKFAFYQGHLNAYNGITGGR